MSRKSFSLIATALVLPAMFAFADDAKAPAKVSTEKMTPQTRLLVIRDLTAERVFARRMFPMGEKGLQHQEWSGDSRRLAGCANWSRGHGLAARARRPGCNFQRAHQAQRNRPGDQRWIRRRKRSGISTFSRALGVPSAPVGGAPKSLEAKGSQVTLEFDKYVPELTGEQVRDMLSPVFDFKALNQAEAYAKTLPPKVQEAIKNHKVLVGMDRDMVIYAKGRPPKKIRDKDDKGQDYEEWIYGEPPAGS